MAKLTFLGKLNDGHICLSGGSPSVIEARRMAQQAPHIDKYNLYVQKYIFSTVNSELPSQRRPKKLYYIYGLLVSLPSHHFDLRIEYQVVSKKRYFLNIIKNVPQNTYNKDAKQQYKTQIETNIYSFNKSRIYSRFCR